MAAPQRAASKQAKSTGEVVGDLWTLLRDYGKQETIDPLKSLGRFVGFGTGAAVCWGIAGTVLVLALMRFMQVEFSRWINDGWTWLPYVVALAASGGAAYASVKLIKKDRTS